MCSRCLTHCRHESRCRGVRRLNTSSHRWCAACAATGLNAQVESGLHVEEARGGPSVSHSQTLLPTPGLQLVAYVVRLRGHMSKALLRRLQAVCVSHPPPKRDQTWRPVHYRLPVTHKIPQLKSVSKYAAGTAADAADAGRGVLHSTISLRHRVVVHTAIRLPFSARSAANVLSAFPLSLPPVSQCPPTPSGLMLALTR